MGHNKAEITAGSISREIGIEGNQIVTSGLRVDGTEILAGPSPETAEKVPGRSISPGAVPGRKYTVTRLFSGKKFGSYTGAELSKGTLMLSLPVYGPEILELS